jgi:hypothetical protein
MIKQICICLKILECIKRGNSGSTKPSHPDLNTLAETENL